MSDLDFNAWRSFPMTGDIDLSVVIPAYNERRRILPTIASISAHLCNTGLRWELIVSDDGSTDGMVDMIDGLGLANVHVVGSGRNEGKGAAIRRGLLSARGKAVLFTDADMSTPIDELDSMLERLAAGADIVVGSRAADGASAAEKSLLRRMMSSSLRLVVSVLLPTGVRDTQCGFKLFTRAAARELAELQTIDGFSFDLELLYIARRRRLRVAEVPVAWVDAPGSKVDPAREAVRFLRDILRIRRRALAGAYAVVRTEHIKLALVTPYPPSTKTLNEYAVHLTKALAGKPEISRLTLLHDECAEGSPTNLPAGVDARAAWKFDSVWSLVRIVRAVHRERPDVVMFNLQFATFGNKRVPAALGLFAPLAVRLLGTPSVVLLHNLVDTVDLETAGFGTNKAKLAMLRTIGRLLTRVVLQATRVAVTIPAYAEILAERYGADNVYLSPHGTFDVEPSTVDAAPAAATRQLLTFGKFGTYKRVEPLVEAYRLLLEAGYDDVELVIAGTDAANSPDYLAGVRAANADLPGLIFTGYVAEEDVPGLFERAEMVVFPYTGTTGSSGPLHQAGAAGKAAVLPAIGDFIDVISEEGFAGETFEPGDSFSLASAMTRLLEDDDRRTSLGRQNGQAARALSITDIADWHVLHMAALATD